MPGPRRKSDATRKQQGNPGHRKTAKADMILTNAEAAGIENASALEARHERVVAPDFLSKSQRAIWAKVAPSLGWIRAADAMSFARYCQWLERYFALEKKSRRVPVVSTTKSKHVNMERIGKAFVALATVDRQLMAYEDRFGMNPRERMLILSKMAHADTPPPRRERAEDGGKTLDAPAVSPPGAPARGPVGFLSARVKPH